MCLFDVLFSMRRCVRDMNEVVPGNRIHQFRVDIGQSLAILKIKLPEI